MSKLLAFSFDAPASPSVTLRWRTEPTAGGKEGFGWGMAWYPPDDKSAVMIKDPTAVSDDPLTQVLRDWSRFRSTVFVCHVRGAADRRSQDDTQPFTRIFANRSWTIAHNGQLEPGYRQRLSLGDDPIYEPAGHTDTEHVLCWLLIRARQHGARSMSELGYETLHAWLGEVNACGSANFLISDGLDLIVYQDARGFRPLHRARFTPASGVRSLQDPEVEIDLSDPLDQLRTAVVVSTEPLAEQGFHALDPGAMMAIRRSAFVWSSIGDPEQLNRELIEPLADTADPPDPAAAMEQATHQTRARPSQATYSRVAFVNPGPMPDIAPETLSSVLKVRHVTRYHYSTPIELSRHILRLRPASDRYQHLLSHELTIIPHGAQRDFDDVFGNQVLRLDLQSPFTKMVVESLCRVRVIEDTRSIHDSSRRRSTIPVPWMPWDRQMMSPYLLPVELPETQLRELFDFAMSFVERQDSDLLSTFEDMNQTIFRDWAYVPASTTVRTTPFEVFSQRRGVCQDFANLMITLARLIGVPARYRTGYIYTGRDAANAMQSDASHAWVELYLPLWGWTGFDPTNGCRANLDHVRVACGRNYRDAAPTSGTIYRGGGTETLEVDVTVQRIE